MNFIVIKQTLYQPGHIIVKTGLTDAKKLCLSMLRFKNIHRLFINEIYIYTGIYNAPKLPKK